MTKQALIPIERIEQAILLIRGQKVMLDRDLALLYGVETKTLNRAVRRHLKRFPADLNRESVKRDGVMRTKTETPGSGARIS